MKPLDRSPRPARTGNAFVPPLRRDGASWLFALVTSSLLSACQHPPLQPLTGEPQLKVFGDRLVFAGHITKSAAKQFLEKARSERITKVVIASPGGDVDAVIDMAEVIVERGLDVEVQGLCISSCANYIFPAGKAKTIAPGAIVGWHGNVGHLAYLDRIDSGRSPPRLREATLKIAAREDGFFRAIGVDGFICWFGKIPPYDVKGTYALSVEDMAHFGIRNVSAPPDYTSTDLAALRAQGRERVEFIKVDRPSLDALRSASQE